VNAFSDHVAREARLRILKELERQTDGRASELALRATLDVYGIKRDRDWIATQLRKLEQLDAIIITMLGPTMVAAITRTGLDHVDERSVLEGVARPREIEE
jgi:hypothetical protein